MPIHNLPAQPTPFVGRIEELAEITALLADSVCRLLTIVGPGGIGKTRLALEAATKQVAHFAQGVYFMVLTPVDSADLLPSAIASALKISFSGAEEPRLQIINYLREKHLLLVLDNFEHLLEGTALLTDLLAAAPAVKVLATSRERLNMQEEWTLTLEGLTFPSDLTTEAIEDYSAVELFVQRARQLQTTFALKENIESVTAICQWVEGMPLGIELAATWLRAMTCQQIAEQIGSSMDFLTTPLRNIPERHRSLRAVFEQSWRLLTESEREVLMRLSVFRGGFDRGAAAVVAGATLNVLAGLADKSLLRVNPGGRYDLHELLRQYGEEQLNTNIEENQQVQDLHGIYYAELLHRLAADLKGPRQIAAMRVLEDDLDNVRAGWRWAVTHGNGDAVLQSVDSLTLFYQIRSRFHEGSEAFGMAVKRFEGTDSALLGQLLMLQGWFAHFLADGARCLECIRKGAAIFHQLDIPMAMMMPLRLFGYFLDEFGGFEAVQQFNQDHLIAARSRGDRWETAWALHSMGEAAFIVEKYAEAQEYYQESLAHFRAIGDRWGSSWPMSALATIAQELGNYKEAQQYHLEHQTISKEIGDLGGIGWSLAGLGIVAYALGEHETFRRYFGEALNMSLELGATLGIVALVNWAIEYVMLPEGQPERAVELLVLLHNHSVARDMYGDKLARRLDALKAELPRDVFATAVQIGQDSSLESAAAVLLEHLSAPDKKQDAADLPVRHQYGKQNHALIVTLTKRELEILHLIAQGLSNAEIAQKLFLSVGTVKVHTRNLYGKLGVSTRTQAVAQAQKLNLL